MLTDESKDAILEMARKGKRPIEIAETLGLSAQSVAGFMSKARELGLLSVAPAEDDFYAPKN